ncbi:spindle assembly abnormal protein 6 homolog [Battus philenor]|uniref:spindle assembly abnormal protein 6 homolog n=1 Tax=Battus philenor TaxID=42288 RepID=UPI0035CF2EE5
MVSKNFYKGKYYITYKHGFEDCKRHIIISIDKIFENDSLVIIFSDEEDPTFLFRICITKGDYEELKKQQGLLIDFDNFPSQIVRLLQQCASNNMFLIIHQINPLKYNFEIVEHNEFKRLIHLSLSTGPATDLEVKQHMAETISNLKKNLVTIKNMTTSNEAVLNDKIAKMEGKIQDLTHIVMKMEEDKLRRETEYFESLKLERDRLSQEKLQWQKTSELNTKTIIATSQENLNKKEKQIDDLNVLCKQLHDNIRQLESQLSDKTQRNNLIENEVQKTHIEIATLKAKNGTLERELNEKDKQIKQMQTHCAYLEKANKDSSESLKGLNESLQTVIREKESLEKRLSLSESLANRNNEAAHSTAEQLLKANEIISKLNRELIELKEKLLCRTAIALEQEKVIERNVKEIQDLKSEIDTTKVCMNTVKTELESLKEKYEDIGNVLKDREETIKNNNMVIQWLHKKMEDRVPDNGDKQKYGVQSSSSTPYFISKDKKANILQESDDTINFYATSKTSSLEDSCSFADTGERKIGLDPKYLKPAVNDRESRKTKDSARSITVSSKSQKGKENKNTDLPKVDYREKKSSRTTYRATPVSAYFP